MRSANEDPIKTYRYRVEIDGFEKAGFTSCSGLAIDMAVVEYREGGMNETPQKSLGLASFSDINLVRGQIAGGIGEFDILNWEAETFDLAILGHPGEYRRDLDIVQYNNFGAEIRRWRVINCIIKNMKPMGDLNGQASENSMESMTLAHEGYRLAA